MSGSSETHADDTVFITGGGGAVAPSVAAAFLDLGSKVALFDRAGRQARVIPSLPRFAPDEAAGRLFVHGVDLASEADAHRAFTEAEEQVGACRALINLAGGFTMAPAQEADSADLEHMLDANLRSAVNATRAILPGMTERGSGFVLAIGAGAALAPSSGKTAYAAAKAAVTAYFGSLAVEVGRHGVNVAVLHPMGTIDTPANRAAMPAADPSNWISLEAMSEAIVYLSTRPARGRVHELKLHAL